MKEDLSPEKTERNQTFLIKQTKSKTVLEADRYLTSLNFV